VPYRKWVSPIQVVQKKKGMMVVEINRNKLIPQRTIVDAYFELKIMRIQISCQHILPKNGQLRVSTLKYCYIGIWTDMQINHTPSSKLQNPTSQSMPISLPWTRAQRQLLHEHIKDECQH